MRVSSSRLWALAAVLVLLAAQPLLGLGARSGGGAGHVVGYLGVDVRDISDDQMTVLKLKDVHGAEIVRVDHDGPAGKCGLRVHDVVLKMNGQAIEGEEQIRHMLRDLGPGRTVVMVISRDGQPMNVNTQMADRNTVEREAWEQHITDPQPGSTGPVLSDHAEGFLSSGGPTGTTGAPVHGAKSFLGSMLLMSPSYTGAMLEMMGPQLAEYFGVPGSMGLLVRSVEENSPAAIAGMRAGDVALRVNEQTLTSTGEWAKMIRESKGRPVTVVVLRDHKERTLTLTPDGKKRSSLERPEHGVLAMWACLTKL